jgi:hypothetical protein
MGMLEFLKDADAAAVSKDYFYHMVTFYPAAKGFLHVFFIEQGYFPGFQAG